MLVFLQVKPVPFNQCCQRQHLLFIYIKGHLGSCASLTHLAGRLRSNKQIRFDDQQN